MNGSSECTHRNDDNNIEVNTLNVAENSTKKENKSDAAPLNSSLDLIDRRTPGVGASKHYDLEEHIAPDVRVGSPQTQSCCGCWLVLLSSLLHLVTILCNRLFRYFSSRERIAEPFSNNATSNPNVSFTYSKSPAGGNETCSVSHGNGGTHLNLENHVGFSFISSSESNDIPASTQEPGFEVPGLPNSTENCSGEQGNKLDEVCLSEDIFSILVDKSLDGEEKNDSKQMATGGNLDEKPTDQIFAKESDDYGSAATTSTAETSQFCVNEDDGCLADDSSSGDDSDSDTIVGSIMSLHDSQISSLDRCSSLKDFDHFTKRVSDIDFAIFRNEKSVEPLASSPGRISGSKRNSPGSLRRTRNSGGSSRRRLEKVGGPKFSSESNDGLSSFSFAGALSRIVEHNYGSSNAEEIILRQKSKDSGLEKRRLPSVIAPREAMTQESKPYCRKSFLFSTPAKPGELLIGMCRETQFYSHSFGEGVSETESEEDDEDNTPTPTPSLHGSSCHSLGPRTARRRLGSVEASSKGADLSLSSTSFDRGKTRFRDKSASVGQGLGISSSSSVVSRFGGGGGSSFEGQSSAEERRRGGEGRREDDRGREYEKDLGGPIGVARTPSQFSDLERETAGSKRNSQAVSSEASEVDDLSSLTNSDLDSCVDTSSPRSSLLHEGSGHPDQSPPYGDAPRPGSGPGVGPSSSGDASGSVQLCRAGSGDLYQDSSSVPLSGSRRNRISTSSFEGGSGGGRSLSSSSVGKFTDGVGKPSRPSNNGRSSHFDTTDNGSNYEENQQYYDTSGKYGSSSSNNYANSHRNSYTSKDQFTSFDGTSNSSGLAASTTCPEFYNQASSHEDGTGQSTGKIQHNRSDQDLHSQKQKQISLQQQKENKNSHHGSLDSHSTQTPPCGEMNTVLQETHKHNRGPPRQKHPSGGSIGPEDEDVADRIVRRRSGDAEVIPGYTAGDNFEGPGAEMSLGSEEHSQQDPRQTKAYRIALELLSTEETYVQVLHLIDQEFQFRVDQENRAHPMFSADHIPQMFSNVKSIYKLHHDFLLPQLQERLNQWDTCPRIGDIMTKLAPFLKMYTEYVKNFDHAMTVINTCQAKCPRFANIMTQIHQLESCGNLTLQHHMLSPVQRIPRYELLLRDYLRKLPAHHQDRHDTTKALHLVATAASHANEAMKKIDKFQKLLEVQDNISGCVDLVSPTRELIKQGKIIKISARSGDHQERYLYLLSDLLLLCSPRLGGRVIHGPQHRLRARYNVENLHVVEGDNLETANTFYIRDASKTVELYTQTFEEKEAWLAALFCAIEETYRRKSSLKLSGAPYGSDDDFDSSISGGSELGSEQPLLVPVEGVAKCMKCGAQFSMVRRKHHCRACGSVVCNKCSSYKAALACEGGRSVKVCRSCHARLTQTSSGSLAQPSVGDDSLELGGQGGEGSACSSRMSSMDGSDLMLRTRGVLEVPASAAGAVIQGHLQLKTHRKAWQQRWFALHTDFVLYSFRSNADDSALTATPLPGYTVTLLQGSRSDGSGVCDKDRERAFKLHYSKKQYVFLATNKEECGRWALQLQRASRAEIPPPDEIQ